MFFKPYYLGCLAHASYLIGDNGEAVVIDPQRDVDFYIEDAKQAGLRIKHIIETHLHADFVSGHIELSKKTGAKIYFGHRAEIPFEHIAVKDGDTVKVGSLIFTFLETPGHTPESVCVLLKSPERPMKLFTGDTLFIGDVGRPDLVGSKGFTAEQMAKVLYTSLHEKIMTLPDETEVYPAHGAGSACGKNISSDRSSTIGTQKKTNYALQTKNADEFVRLVAGELAPPPPYFPVDAELNRNGPVPLGELPKLEALSPQEFILQKNKGATIVDVRSSEDFCQEHIPESIHVSLKGSFGPWAGTVIPTEASLLLIVDESKKEEAQMRLARVGLENVVGFLKGGMDAWKKSGNKSVQIQMVDVGTVKNELDQSPMAQVLDVRKPSEFEQGHLPKATNIPLDEFAQKGIFEKLSSLNRELPLYVTCQSGFRSSIAVSLLEKYNFHRIINVSGGTQAWKNASYPLSR